MTNFEPRERNLVRRAVGLLAAVYAGTFVVAVLLHLGVQVPLGFGVLDEPRKPIAVIVEAWPGFYSVWGPSPSSPERPGHGPR